MSVTTTQLDAGAKGVQVEDVISGTGNLAVSTQCPDPNLTTADQGGLEALLRKLGLLVPVPSFDAADILSKPLDIGRSYLADILYNLEKCDRENAFNSIQISNDIESEDLMVRLPKVWPGDKFKEIGEKISFNVNMCHSFPKSLLFTVPFVDGVHMRVIFAQPTFARLLLPYITDRKESYGRHRSTGLHESPKSLSDRKKLVIEFSSPNLASEFHPKHLRSTILGAAIANLYDNMGWDVLKLNYLGDWGKPIALLGVGWERFGSEEKFKVDPVGHLHEVYNQINELFLPEQIASKKARDESLKHHEAQDTAGIESHGLFAERNAYFKRMEDGEEEALAFWKRVREVNVKNFVGLYSRLNISFDEYSGESQVSPESEAEVESILRSKGLLEESAGASIIDLKKHTDRAGTAIIRDRTGSSTYLLRDLAAVFDREKKYSFDKMLYVVAADHNLHFSRLSKILGLMGKSDLASKLHHVSFSEVTKSADKPGTTFEEIVTECQSAMQQSFDAKVDQAALLSRVSNTSEVVTANSLIIQELSAKRGNDLPFDMSRMTSFEAGTGPNLQYYHAMVCTILKDVQSSGSLSEKDFASFEDMDYLNLLRLLAQYPDMTLSAFKALEPSTIVAYISSVVEHLSTCLDEDGDPGEIDVVQATILKATQIVLENGMKLLGLIVPA